MPKQQIHADMEKGAVQVALAICNSMIHTRKTAIGESA